jgi:hypothetical protein
MKRKCDELDDFLANSASKFETVILNEVKHIHAANDSQDVKLEQISVRQQTIDTIYTERWNNLFSRLSILETKTKITSAVVAVIVAGLISIAFGTLTAAPTIAPGPIISTEKMQSASQDNTGVK